MQKRYEDAWKVAREATRVLYASFLVKKVMVFGSLIDRSRFHRWSDIDLAVWGIPDELDFRAYGVLMILTFWSILRSVHLRFGR